MERARAKKAARTTPETSPRKHMRMHFELALELGVTGRRPLQETLRNAVETAGCDVAVELPTMDGQGILTVIRRRDGDADCFLQVRTAETGFDVVDEADIDPDLLKLARSFLDVLGRLYPGGNVSKPLSPAAH